jgi:sulfatase maturation enzyme AslB (radical SAM superfamily)
VSSTDQVQRTPVSDEAGVPPRFHVMAKPTGAVCNLACSYCFFLDKEELYPGSGFRMERISAATWPTRCLSMPLTTICVGTGTSNSIFSGGGTTTGCEYPTNRTKLSPCISAR